MDIIKDLVSRYGEGLQYSGFNTKDTRKKMIEMGVTKEEIVKLLMAYIAVGNNHENLINKVRDINMGREMLKVIKRYEIKERPKGKDSGMLTLPRIASAFGPVLYLIRCEMNDRGFLQEQIETSTPLEYQDLAFSSLSVARDFCIKFSTLIGNQDRRHKTNQSEEELMKEAEMYCEIAKKALDNDRQLKTYYESMSKNSDIDSFPLLFQQ